MIIHNRPLFFCLIGLQLHHDQRVKVIAVVGCSILEPVHYHPIQYIIYRIMPIVPFEQ